MFIKFKRLFSRNNDDNNDNNEDALLSRKKKRILEEEEQDLSEHAVITEVKSIYSVLNKKNTETISKKTLAKNTDVSSDSDGKPQQFKIKNFKTAPRPPLLYDDNELTRYMNHIEANPLLNSLELDDKYIEQLRSLEHNGTITPVVSLKMRYLYKIILGGLIIKSARLIKKYTTTRIIHGFPYYGVYSSKSFIIKLDSGYDAFYEYCLHQLFGPGINREYNVVLPYIFHMNTHFVKEQEKQEKQEKEKTIKKTDAEIEVPEHLDNVKNTLTLDKIYTTPIYFSIQPYLENSYCLYDWLRDNQIRKNDARNNDTEEDSHSGQSGDDDMTPCILLMLRFMRRIARVLAVLHKHNLVHGDIKSDNILVVKIDTPNAENGYEDYDVFLIDFGLTGIVGKMTGTGGTKPYCHPKTGNSKKRDKKPYLWTPVQPCNDTWSLGLLFLTVIMYGKCKSTFDSYDYDFFQEDGYVNMAYIRTYLSDKYADFFEKIVSPESIPAQEICDTLDEFIANYKIEDVTNANYM